jgi:hypothetical protein
MYVISHNTGFERLTGIVRGGEGEAVSPAQLTDAAVTEIDAKISREGCWLLGVVVDGEVRLLQVTRIEVH